MGTRFNLAHCWEQIGRTASAWGLFLDVASAASASGQKKREKAARQRAEALEPRLARLLIEVPHPVPGLVVTRAGESVAAAAWGTAIPVDPGVQRVEASAAGRVAWSEEVTLDAPGQALSVVVPELELERLEPPPEPPVATQPDVKRQPSVDHDSRGISSGRIVTSSLLGAVGVGGIAVGAVYGLRANAETAAARGVCVGGDTGNVCDRDRADPNFDLGRREFDEREKHRSNSERAALIGYIGWGVGAAGLIASTIVLLTTPQAGQHSESDVESARFEIVPIVSSSDLGASLRANF